MQTLLAWILVTLVIAGAYPWSAWLLTRSNRSDGMWLTLLLTLSLSIGALTLLMFWESLFGISFSLWTITLPYLGLMLPGFWLWRRGQSKERPQSIESRNQPSLYSIPRWFAGSMLALISAAILFNAAYWPFYRDDTLGIYHRYGKLMYETGTIVPFEGRNDAFYQAYPMQLPLAYTYSYIASGWINEYLAKTIAALFSLACLPATFLLGRMMFDSLAGWLGALLLAFAPTFGRWASAGYVDLPMAFLYTLTAIFAWRLWEKGHWADALLTGVAIGLAAWTKNAALVGICYLLLWLLYAWRKKRIPFQHLLLVLGTCAVIAAPWYIRNWFEARLIVPPTAWTEQAERSLSTLFLFIMQSQNFALTGWVILAAVGASILSLLQRRIRPQHVMLLGWTIPFFAVWWLLVSYDPRFALLFLPLLCVIGGEWLARVFGWLPHQIQKRVPLPVTFIALAWSLYIVWISVEYKDAILRAPLMGDTAKHEIVLRGDD
jgi:4-amino-4-deoxy-L-arabinose transferase-like glycosyltransferase